MEDQAQFKIERGIAPPKKFSRTNWPFGEMQVGDSFALDEIQFIKTSSAASVYGKRHNLKFSIRRQGEGYRCWRIA